MNREELAALVRAVVTGTVAARAAELGITSFHLSLSHDAGIASAVVIGEGP